MRFDDERVERKIDKGFGVVVCRARRWRVQRGMVKEADACDVCIV